MYTAEPSITDTGSVYVVHLVATMLACTSHQAVYFTLGLTFWAIHFAHYFFLLVTLLCLTVVKRHRPRLLTLKDALSIGVSQLLVSTSTCLIHDNGSNGALYAQRFSDFLVTLLVILLGKYFIDQQQFGVTRKFTLLLIILGVSSSFAWLEKLMTVTFSYVYLLPILAISTAVHFLFTVKIYRNSINAMTFEDFLFNVALWTSLLLLPGAILFRTDSVTKEWYKTAAAWEISDYGIFVMSYISLTIMVYSKYWLLCKCTQETYLAMRHCKYLIASYGQLFFQYMAHINVVSGFARIIGAGAMIYYVQQRKRLMESHQKHGLENGV